METQTAPKSPAEWSQSRDNPYLQDNLRPVTDEIEVKDLKIEGDLPDSLSGVFLRNGPNPQFEPPGHYHSFDGDGMVHGVFLRGGKASYKNRWVVSDGLRYERAQGHAVFSGFGEFKLPPPKLMAKYGVGKALGNISVVRQGGRFLALYEGSRPVELSPDLETIGEFDFERRLQGPFSAHCHTDPETGELFSFGYSPMKPFLRYLVVNRDCALVRCEPIPTDYPVMIHDFMITEHHVLFHHAPAVLDMQRAFAGGDVLQWQPERGTRIGVMPRHGNVDEMRWIDAPNCYVFHFINAYERGDEIILDGLRAAGVEKNVSSPDGTGFPPKLTRFTIDLRGDGSVAEEQLLHYTGEFPQCHPGHKGRPYRYAYMMAAADGVERLKTGVLRYVVRHDLQTGETTRYHLGPRRSGSEFAFVPDPEGTDEGHGWLLGYVYDPDDDSSQMWVMRADRLVEGPVARIHLPRRVPEGFHAAWFGD